LSRRAALGRSFRTEAARQNSDALFLVLGIRPPAGASHRIRDPYLLLRVSDADGDAVFVATDSFSTVYGAGDSPRAAIENYSENLFEYYEELEEDEEVLAPGLRRELLAMRPHFAPLP